MGRRATKKNNKNKNTKMSGACGTNGREERCTQNFGAKPRGKEMTRKT